MAERLGFEPKVQFLTIQRSGTRRCYPRAATATDEAVAAENVMVSSGHDCKSACRYLLWFCGCMLAGNETLDRASRQTMLAESAG